MRRSLLCGVLVAAALGCQPADYGPAPATTFPTRDLLEESVSLDVDPASSVVVLTVAEVSGDQAPRRVTVGVLGGRVVLRAQDEGALVAEQVGAQLDDVVVGPEELPPVGLHLTELEVHLEKLAILETAWSEDGNAASASGTLDLVLDWSMVAASGKVVKLAAERISRVQVDLAIGRSASGGLVVSLYGQRDGVFLTPGGVFALSDLKLDLGAEG